MQRVDARQLQQQIANLYLEYPELRDDDEVLRVDMLEGSTDLHEMATVILDAIDKNNDLYEGAGNRLADLKMRKARLGQRDEFLRGMLLKIMQAAELKKLELPIATLSVRNGQPQIVGEPDPASLPDQYVKIKREADRSKIREALLRGDTVPGLFLSNAQPTLAIHPK